MQFDALAGYPATGRKMGEAMGSSDRVTGIAGIFTSDDVRMLADIGFMTLGRGNTKGARKIFDGLAVLRPGSDASMAAEATYMLATGEPHKAAEFLRGAEPSHTTSVLLAVALLGAKQGTQAMDVLQEAIAAFPESDFARRVLSEIQVSLSGT